VEVRTPYNAKADNQDCPDLANNSTQEAVDVEGLKRNITNYDRELEHLWTYKKGWNDCIDYLAEQGLLSAKETASQETCKENGVTYYDKDAPRIEGLKHALDVMKDHQWRTGSIDIVIQAAKAQLERQGE